MAMCLKSHEETSGVEQNPDMVLGRIGWSYSKPPNIAQRAGDHDWGKETALSYPSPDSDHYSGSESFWARPYFSYHRRDNFIVRPIAVRYTIKGGQRLSIPDGTKRSGHLFFFAFSLHTYPPIWILKAVTSGGARLTKKHHPPISFYGV
jgi:hypothetical protein